MGNEEESVEESISSRLDKAVIRYGKLKEWETLFCDEFCDIYDRLEDKMREIGDQKKECRKRHQVSFTFRSRIWF